MCACEDTYVCARCKGTPHDPAYWLEDPTEDDAQAREERAFVRVVGPREASE